ncbi:hypothetical protein V8G54_006387 [Vigna mungo]|uniref:Uncharacterized protein n=1 Tax=Vigna mungo TaxID=3915 RepID=A0AAQ3NZW0_VIGMU
MNQYWVALILANISPCSHVSDLITSRAILLYFILQGRQISLVAGVDTSEAPFERPWQKIDRAYFKQHCMSNAAGIPPPRPQQPHDPDQPPQPAHQDPQDAFSTMEMRQMLQHLSAQMVAVNRIGQAQATMMRQAFAASHMDFMTPAEYTAFVAWPGDQPHTMGRGGTSAGVGEQDMDEDGTEVEDE